MFAIEKMTEEMRPEVMPMVDAFYNSDAVSHEVEREKLEQTFADAVSADPILEGYVLKEDAHRVGFGYSPVFYGRAGGGPWKMFWGLYLKAEGRGKGLGRGSLQEWARAAAVVKVVRGGWKTRDYEE